MPPDSKRRRKLKKQRRRDREGGPGKGDGEGPGRNDDAERNTNHAIAHGEPKANLWGMFRGPFRPGTDSEGPVDPVGSEDRFGPGAFQDPEAREASLS